tara:strand:- start:1717 stop:1965 length:249 start_codon:yes stop_codon:yes gene_type:complete
MKAGDLVLSTVGTSKTQARRLPPGLSKIGLVISTRKLVDKRPLDLQLRDPYPEEPKIVTVMFTEARYTYCFPEHYLELISEA